MAAYFHLFEAKITISSNTDYLLEGNVAWTDGDEQQVRWLQQLSDDKLESLIDLCIFLKKEDIIESDRILVSETNLMQMLKAEGWNVDKAANTLDILLNVEVKMLDNGLETDSFFLHF